MTSNLGRSDPYQCMTEENLRTLGEQPAEYQAQTLDARVRWIEKINKKVYSELGAILLYMESKELWKLTYLEDGTHPKSFERYMQSACPYSRSYAYEAMGKMRVLQQSGLGMNEVEDIPRCNLVTLAKLSSDVMRNPEVLDAAKHLEEKDFVKKIQVEFPMQHIENKRKLVFRPEVSAAVKIEDALRLAQEIYSCGRDEALEAIAVVFLETCEREKAMTANA